MALSGGGILRRLEPGWRVWDQAGGIWGGLGEGVWEVWEGGVGVAGRRASLCARPVRPGSADKDGQGLRHAGFPTIMLEMMTRVMMPPRC